MPFAVYAFRAMKTKFLFVLSVSALLIGCAQDTLTGDVYSRGEARTAETVQTGRITAIDGVKIEGESQGGGLLGSVAGGFLGSNIGHGRASHTAGAIGGAALGGVAGSHIQQGMGSRQGIRISVKLDGSGRTVAVVQQVNANAPFQVGDRVKVLTSGSRMRVSY